MVRANKLVRHLHVLDRRVAASLGPRGKQNGVGRRVYLELLGVLNGTGRFETIPATIPNTTGLTEKIYRIVSNESDFALPRAVYESAYYDASVDSLINRGRVHRSEWAYLTQLARGLHVQPSYGQDDVATPPPWMADVDESRQELRVWIRELSLQDMLLAAMESYLVPAGSGKPSTEVYGIVFGSFREAEQSRGRFRRITQLDVNVERVCIQQRAKGSPSEVIADARSEATQLAMGEELFPYWQVLGDFHTHAYRTLSELIRSGGWRYSDADECVNIEWCAQLRDRGHNPRVALILAIARAGRGGNGSREEWNGLPHVMRTRIGKCHCFISAYRIRQDGRYSTEGITLKCPSLAGR
ncbi:MAG: hypothetical protein U1D55_13080 [Phycisphaerae bacterium]